MTKVIKQVVSFPTFFGSSKMLHAYNVLFFTEVGFFFSSRRRHTRYWRDWSSDVCSSDLHRGDRGGGCIQVKDLGRGSARLDSRVHHGDIRATVGLGKIARRDHGCELGGTHEAPRQGGAVPLHY